MVEIIMCRNIKAHIKARQSRRWPPSRQKVPVLPPCQVGRLPHILQGRMVGRHSPPRQAEDTLGRQLPGLQHPQAPGHTMAESCRVLQIHLLV